MYDAKLDTFICVADSGSFGSAAEKLYITPPAVIKQINLLEKNLGLKLFVRTSKGVELTNAGRSYYSDAKKMVKLSRDALARARRADLENYVVRIGVSLLTSTEILNHLIPQIEEKDPTIQIKLIPFDNRYGGMPNLLDHLGEEIDVYMLMCDFVKHEHYQVLPLCYEPIGCAMSIRHPLAKEKMLRPEDLFNQNFLLLEKGKNAYLDILRENIQKKYPLIHIQDLQTFNIQSFNRCESSRNLMFGIERWNGKHPLVKVIPVDWNYKVPLGLLYSKEPTDTVRKFISIASREFRSIWMDKDCDFVD